METRSIKDKFWKSWEALHSEVFKDVAISDWVLMGLTMEVKNKTIEIIDKLTEIENHCSNQTVNEG